MLKKKQILLLIGLIISALSLEAQVRLPRLISNGMVLQRDMELTIWGWAEPEEMVTVHFAGSDYPAKTDPSGNWKVQLPPQKAGGPHRMTIRGKNEISIDDILIGDVWVCSGQSNMELKMKRVRPLYEPEIARSENARIRQFEVPQRYDFKKPQADLKGGAWKSANPENVTEFSAVAYFFACEIYEQYQVPIGLITAALGGSPAEAWMSESALQAFPEHYAEAQKFRDDELISKIEADDKERIDAWYQLLWQKDKGYVNSAEKWFDPAFDFSKWKNMEIPGYWAQTDLGAINGVVWFRKNITLPAATAGRPGFLNLGRIVDADSVFINGILVGTTGYQYPPRWYTVPENILKPGLNSLVVRVINSSGKGGFVPDKPYELIVAGDTVDLKGIWQYRLGAQMDPLASQTFVRWKPEGLFNGMIHPLLPFRIKGAIWYQGESNTRRAAEYAQLFPAMIRDWRANWKQGDFPFLFVQLANFMEPRLQPSDSDWAVLRESQLRSLSLPATAMAVTTDIGEWNDIHPLNKKDAGRRLALAAKKVAYNDNQIVYSGPIFRSFEIKKGKAVLSFDHTGSGLTAKGGGALKGFAVAGADRRFVWAEARIEKNRVTVQSAEVPDPVAVRYAWADNPAAANLYNAEGLPASPFRTDDWAPAEVPALKGLKDYYQAYFPMGVAISPAMTDPGPDADFIKKHFNSLTAENAMKMGLIHPQEHRYNWGPADKIVQFAVQNGLRMRGHTLCWHNQTPRWLFVDSVGKQVGKEVLLARLRSHIHEVAGRYKGKIYAWDVVNEAVPDAGTDLYRKSKFYEIIGEEYIARAFEYAHEADPDALLFYNDYNTENASKRDRIYQIVKDLVKKGVPIHGVGLQGHWSIYEPAAGELETSIERFAALGLQVQITELDVSVYPKEHERREKADTDFSVFTAEMEKRQIEQYRMLFEVFRKHRKKITGVTFWNLTDKSSWLDHFPVEGRKDYPLLFDIHQEPKKAFHAVTGF